MSDWASKAAIALHDGPLHLFIDESNMTLILAALQRIRPLVIEAAIEMENRQRQARQAKES